MAGTSRLKYFVFASDAGTNVVLQRSFDTVGVSKHSHDCGSVSVERLSTRVVNFDDASWRLSSRL